MTLPRQLRSPLTPPVTPHNILSNNNVNKLNCNAIIIVRLFNHNSAYSEVPLSSNDVPLSSNYRNCANLWKDQSFIVKRSNKTKYESTNRYQLITYEAYHF